MLLENLMTIKEKTHNAVLKSNRSLDSVKLIGVTKTIDISKVREVIQLGIKDIGENRVQELIKRQDDLIDKDVNYHMIGHLQSNKVKYIINNIEMIHSLDRISLAKEIQKRASRNNVKINVLVQVNIAEEKSKFGLKKEEVIPFIHKISNYENLIVNGLMTMAPYSDNAEDSRWVFKSLKDLFEEIKTLNIPNIDMKYLSMGMTNDFEVAIEEGSNIIRVGTGIFGQRK